MDNKTLKALEKLGILSSRQVEMFALGGVVPPPDVEEPIGPDLTDMNNLSLNQPGYIASLPPMTLQTRPSGLDQNALASYFGQQSSTSSMATIPTPQEAPNGFGNDYNAYLADAKKYQGKYRDSQAVDSAYQIGKISKEERDRLQLLSPEDLKKETAKSDSNVGAQQDNARMNAWMKIMAPGVSDISTEAYNAGRYAGAPKGTPGRTAGLIGNIGAGLFDIARNVASGVGFSKMNAYENNYYNDLLNQRKYTNASQTQNVDNSETFRDGGLFATQHFELGGAAQEQAMPPEQGQPNLEQTAQQLVQQLKSLEAIDAYLQEKQVDEETYQTIMQIAEQMLGEKSAPEEEQPESQEIPEMKGGGKFKHKVGDSIEFTHKGKTHRGIISKIENGQIYL